METEGRGCLITVLVFFGIAIAIAFAGYAMNGYSAACKLPMHNYKSGDSIICCHSYVNGQCS